MGLDGEGASPGGGGNSGSGGPPRGYLGATTPPYLSTSRSPSLPPQFPYPPDAGLSVYTTLGKENNQNQCFVFFSSSSSSTIRKYLKSTFISLCVLIFFSYGAISRDPK